VFLINIVYYTAKPEKVPEVSPARGEILESEAGDFSKRTQALRGTGRIGPGMGPEARGKKGKSHGFCSRYTFL
jgi:hypothetical protein